MKKKSWPRLSIQFLIKLQSLIRKPEKNIENY